MTETHPILTFDYEAAWHEAAAPAFEALPANLRDDLLGRVARDAGHLNQLPDLSMPWPDPDLSDLRVRFAAIPAEWLAQAARVIYVAGHWYPGTGRIEMHGHKSGAHWKFSHYADQDLRERLIIGGPFQVHEGAIRLSYSSRDAWTWAEVAPATVKGLDRARALSEQLTNAIRGKNGRDRDGAAWAWFEALKARDLDWPAAWAPLMNMTAYMRPTQEIRVRRLAAITPEEHAATRAKSRARIVERFAEATIKAERQQRADLWVHDAGLDTDNAIFYGHDNRGAGLICFGWRELVTDAIRDRILAAISECPFAYRIKCADGRTLEGGIG